MIYKLEFQYSKMIEVKLPYLIPSKKNQQQMWVNKKTGKRFIKSSDKYNEIAVRALLDITVQTREFKDILPIQEVLFAEFEFHHPDKRGRDNINAREGFQDLLVQAGIIEDDNYKVLSKAMDFGSYKKDLPCSIVRIFI